METTTTRTLALGWWNKLSKNEQEYYWLEWCKNTNSNFRSWSFSMFSASSSCIELAWKELIKK